MDEMLWQDADDLLRYWINYPPVHLAVRRMTPFVAGGGGDAPPPMGAL